MASIIEKKPGVAEERPAYSGVFVNRLRLRCDALTGQTQPLLWDR